MEYLPIFDSSNVILSGNAHCVQEQSMLFHKAVFMSSLEDSLSVEVAGCQVGIIFFRHDWSGIVEVVVGEQVQRVDLFSATPMHWLLEVPLRSSQEAVPLTIQASGKKNKASHASEVWVEGVYVTGLPYRLRKVNSFNALT